MDQVKSNSVVLNLYYKVGDYDENDLMRTENVGEIVFEVANNLFRIYVVYLQTCVREFFNLLKPITELITDNYLSVHGCKKTVAKFKKRIIRRSCLVILKLE